MGNIKSWFFKDTKYIIPCCENNKKDAKENIVKWKESIEKNIDIDEIQIIHIENKWHLVGIREDDYKKNLFY